MGTRGGKAIVCPFFFFGRRSRGSSPRSCRERKRRRLAEKAAAAAAAGEFVHVGDNSRLRLSGDGGGVLVFFGRRRLLEPK